jgi:hypothetical protein
MGAFKEYADGAGDWVSPDFAEPGTCAEGGCVLAQSQ